MTDKYGYLRECGCWYLVPSEKIEQFDSDWKHQNTVCWKYKDYKDVICPESDWLQREWYALCKEFKDKYKEYRIGNITELINYRIPIQ